jgi:hypothetical protein
VVYTGSNVLFTLGLISVVVLLIVGWVMTQGGMNTLAEKGRNLVSIPLNPSPTPTALPIRKEPIAGPSLDRVKAEYEEKIRQLQQAAEKRESEVRNQYVNQINDLKLQIQILQDENQRLRGGK